MSRKYDNKQSTRRPTQVRNHLNDEEANETGKIVLNGVSQEALAF